MTLYNKRKKKKNTKLFFDSFKHFKNNLSNLIGVELPTFNSLGKEKYYQLKAVNYKSKCPDMQKIGLVERLGDNDFNLTQEGQYFIKNHHLNQHIYNEASIKSKEKGIRQKDIDTLKPQILISYFSSDPSYRSEILKLILSYYDTADAIRPYLALVKIIRKYKIKKLNKDCLKNILAHTKEEILLMDISKEDVFHQLDEKTQQEVIRPCSYIYNFLETALVVDSSEDRNVIIDYKLIDKLEMEMNSIVYQQSLQQKQNNSRPAKEQRIFRDNVLKAYGYKCAITRQSIFIGDRCLLEAAHIIPYKDGGSFAVSNGIALSYEMHKMFDNGLFGFVYDNTGEVKIKISQSSKIKDKDNVLNNLQDRVIFLPEQKSHIPDRLALEYRMQKHLLR